MRTIIRRGAIVTLCAALALWGCSPSTENSQGGSGRSDVSEFVTVPSGTSMTVSLDQRLNTGTDDAGDRFTAHTVSDVVIDRATVFPAGSTVRGHLMDVEQPHRTVGRGQMTLAFDEIIDPSGDAHLISAEPIRVVARGDKISDAEKVAGGAVIGGILGALAGKDRAKGALVGATAGAAAGGVVAIATKGKQLNLPVGQRFHVQLIRPIDVPIASLME